MARNEAPCWLRAIVELPASYCVGSAAGTLPIISMQGFMILKILSGDRQDTGNTSGMRGRT